MSPASRCFYLEEFLLFTKHELVYVFLTFLVFVSPGFTRGKGVCISEPVDIKVYKDFFIQLDMPYKAVRLDTISVRATIFNYFSAECEVRLTLSPSVDSKVYKYFFSQLDMPYKAVRLDTISVKATIFKNILCQQTVKRHHERRRCENRSVRL